MLQAHTEIEAKPGLPQWLVNAIAFQAEGLESNMAMARELLQGRDATADQAQFYQMATRELGYTKATIDKIVKIAEDQRLAAAATVAATARKLPAHWTSLHALTTLDNREFGQVMKVINPDMPVQAISNREYRIKWLRGLHARLNGKMKPPAKMKTPTKPKKKKLAPPKAKLTEREQAELAAAEEKEIERINRESGDGLKDFVQALVTQMREHPYMAGAVASLPAEDRLELQTACSDAINWLSAIYDAATTT